jgi:drug/metabolite transporter (DMT)-like permease
VPPLAVGLVLLTALTHVFWNFQIKRSPAPIAYSWWIQAFGALMFLPIGLLAARPVSVPLAGWYCVGGTACFYAAYYTCIALSYRRGDLSRAYPIARGVAPAATVAWGILFHREHPNLTGWIGVTAICGGVFLAARPTARDNGSPLPLLHEDFRPARLAGSLAAIATGLCVSGYSAVDKEGVQLVHPALYLALTMAAGALAQAALIRPDRQWPAYIAEARRGGIGLLLSALAASAGYLLFLAVLRNQPVSYMVPVRSVSVLFSVIAGRQLLSEEAGFARFAAAALIVLGISAIALSR